MASATLPEYDSARARASIIAELRDLYRYRDFLRLLVAKTIKSRYKRSVLGVAWTLLNPLVTMLVMSIAFSTLFRAAIPRYPVYLLVGLTAWNFFSQSTAFAMGQLFAGAALMRRVHLPPTIFAVACIANGLVNLVFALVPLLVIAALLRQPLFLTWWFFPLAILILATFSLGVALLMSWLAALFIDTMEMYQLFLQAVFFLTPILYPVSIIPPHLRWALLLNPMYYMVEITRAPIYDGRLPSAGVLLVSVALAVGSLCLGAWVFTRKADELAYRL